MEINSVNKSNIDSNQEIECDDSMKINNNNVSNENVKAYRYQDLRTPSDIAQVRTDFPKPDDLSVKMDKIIELLSNNPGIVSPASSETNLSLNDFNNAASDSTQPQNFHFHHLYTPPVISQDQPQSFPNLYKSFHNGYEDPLMHNTPTMSVHTPLKQFTHFQGFHPPPYQGAPSNFHRNGNPAPYNPNGFSESHSHQDFQISYQYGHSKMSPQESSSKKGNYVMNGVNGVKIKNCPTSLSYRTIHDAEYDLLNDDENEEMIVENATNQILIDDQAKILKKIEGYKLKTNNEKFHVLEESQPDPKLLHEQKMILKQIEEDKKKKLREEKLSLSLIEELTRQDAQGSVSLIRNGQADGVGYGHLDQAKFSSVSYSDAEFPTLQRPRFDNGWIKVICFKNNKFFLTFYKLVILIISSLSRFMEVDG